MGAWSLDGVNLVPQQLISATMPQTGGKGEPDGLLGSDVLSRFGAVRVDFAVGALIVPGPEGAPLAAVVAVHRPQGPGSGDADTGGAWDISAADRDAHDR